MSLRCISILVFISVTFHGYAQLVTKKDYTAASLVENKAKQYKSKTIIDFYQELIQDFKETGRTGNKSIYTNSLNSLKAFTNPYLAKCIQ